MVTNKLHVERVRTFKSGGTGGRKLGKEGRRKEGRKEGITQFSPWLQVLRWIKYKGGGNEEKGREGKGDRKEKGSVLQCVHKYCYGDGLESRSIL